MTTHLDDWQLSAIAASAELDHTMSEHLGSCLVCRRRLVAFQEAVEEHRRALTETAPDWTEQKQAILNRLDTMIRPASVERQRRWLRPVLAAAATVICVLGAGLLRKPNDSTLIATPRPELPIEEILAQTEALLADDIIPGFDVFEHVTDAEIDSVLASQKPTL